MLIRCERCQALYSLQDGVVRGAPGAALRVECGRCLLVFEPPPPKASSKPPVENDASPVLPSRPVSQPRPSGSAERKPGAASADELARALRPRRPQGSGAPGFLKATREALEDDVYAAEIARRRKRTRVAAIAVAALVLIGLGALGVSAIRHRLGGLPAAAQARLEKARQRLLLDDAQSLEQAAALFTEVSRMAPGEPGPEAERGYALLLLAGAHKDLADRLEAQGRELNDKVAKLQIEKPEGWEKQAGQRVDQVRQISAEREPHILDARRFLQQGLAAAKAALEEEPEDATGQRAMALYYALNDAADRGQRYLDQAEKLQGQDAQNAYVRAALALSGSPSREKQERALSALAVARQAEPRMVRAIYEVAAVEVDRQELGPARQTLAKVLELNPQHERAKRLLSLLSAGQ